MIQKRIGKSSFFTIWIFSFAFFLLWIISLLVLCIGPFGAIWSSDLVISRPKVRLKTGSVFFHPLASKELQLRRYCSDSDVPWCSKKFFKHAGSIARERKPMRATEICFPEGDEKLPNFFSQKSMGAWIRSSPSAGAPCYTLYYR